MTYSWLTVYVLQSKKEGKMVYT